MQLQQKTRARLKKVKEWCYIGPMVMVVLPDSAKDALRGINQDLPMTSPIHRSSVPQTSRRHSGSFLSQRAARGSRRLLSARTAYEWGVVTEIVRDGEALARAIEFAYLYLKVPEVTRRNTRIHFTQPLKERIVREVGYGLSLEGASAADLVKSMQAMTKAQ